MGAEGCFVGEGEEEEEEEEEFFDSREDVSMVFDSCPGSSGGPDSFSDENFVSVSDSVYQFPIGQLSSVQERRAKFLRWMGLEPVCSPSKDGVNLDELAGEIAPDIGTITLDDQAVLMSSHSINGTTMPSSSNEGRCRPKNKVMERNFGDRIPGNVDNTMLVVDASGRDNNVKSISEVVADLIKPIGEFERSPDPLSFTQKVMQRDNNRSNNSEKTASRTRWLWRLGAVACIADRHWEKTGLNLCDSDQSGSSRIQRVRVQPHKKRAKEFSAVYVGQDIKAHDGAILTMKFSPDGQYLASGGEDAVVCVWCVMESERTAENDIPKDDHSCIYFSVNHNSELAPLHVNDEEKKGKLRSTSRTTDSACVVVPPDVFQISEKPLHVFRGHQGDVLDVSWSKSKYLLSSSVDKTVRLWLVGCSSCLKVFSHNDYVTCIQFNPVNEKYFISGSIDGKVRIWEIPGCQVVDWTDIRDIVTAVCYHPDGKDGVVGSMSGDCHFYDVTGNQLQLQGHFSLQSKKKSPYKRITGFQFCPSDHQILMVTSADSQVRVLHGADIVCKYKGLRNAGSQISASFTSDGRHIISASENSYVYVWCYSSQDAPKSNQVKSTRSSERFFSNNASIAVPWQGMESRSRVSELSNSLPLQQVPNNQSQPGSRGDDSLYISPSGSFTLGHEFFSESLPKGSATWPEEKLLSSSMTSPALPKSQYKFLKNCCQNNSHAWGQVIVTAGWDGKIRSYQNYGLPIHV